MNTDNPFAPVITLLDGRTLPCYPKPEATTPIDNSMKLDMTGQYLTIGRKRGRPRVQEPSPEIVRAEKYFTDHAFFFLKHHEQILSDSRMFLAPVSVNNHLAYFGTSCFQHPTLGVYLQWWLTCENTAIEGEVQDDCWLVYLIAGSPLSGANSCGIVNSCGTCKTTSLGSAFSKIWQSFAKINALYDTAKSRYEAFTLEEVVALLQA